MDDNIAIKVDKVNKTFRLPLERQSSIKSLVVNFYRRRKGYELQRVLQNISFEVKEGEFLGIVGRNGSGKSTLLKLLAGIYAPDKGAIQLQGKLTPFIELGVGFNHELTGRENVFLNGALLGFSRKEIEEIYDDIVAFAELEKFMDQKLKNYSSGMQVRLAFSIAIRANTDILLIDEVLAVGDANFQAKCISVFQDLKRRGKTIIFISHDMAMVRQFCDRAIMIQNGKIIAEGNTEKVALEYEMANLPADLSVNAVNEKIKQAKDKIITKLELITVGGQSTDIFKHGEEVRLVTHLKPNTKAQNLGVAVYTADGSYVFGTNTIIDNVDISNQVSYSFKAVLGAGKYRFKIGVFGETDDVIYEFFDNGPTFTIAPEHGKQLWGGVAYLEHEWSNL